MAGIASASLHEVGESLRNRVSVVTGAGGGIGAAVARVLAHMGSTVHLLDVDAALLEQQELTLRGQGLSAQSATVDVRNAGAVGDAIEHVRVTSGRVDILVLSAGVSGAPTSIEDTTPELWSHVLAVDLIGASYCISAAAPIMKEQLGGRIVAVGSIVADTPRLHRGAYAAAKAGLSGLVRVVALELAPFGVTVNAVCPGPTDTDFFRASLRGAADLDARLAAIPAGRLVTPLDVANVVAFLASDCAAAITGQSVHINGGEYMT